MCEIPDGRYLSFGFVLATRLPGMDLCVAMASGGDAGCMLVVCALGIRWQCGLCVVVCARGIPERCEHSVSCMCEWVPEASRNDVGKARGILSGVG